MKFDLTQTEKIKTAFIIHLRNIKRIVDNPDTENIITGISSLRLLILQASKKEEAIVKALMDNSVANPKFMMTKDKEFESNLDNCYKEVIWKEVYPVIEPPENILHLTYIDFMKHTVVKINQTRITVTDIIEFYAYSKGGIHLDRDEDIKGKRLEIKINEQIITYAGHTLFDRTIYGIYKSVYESLSKNKEQLLYNSK